MHSPLKFALVGLLGISDLVAAFPGTPAGYTTKTTKGGGQTCTPTTVFSTYTKPGHGSTVTETSTYTKPCHRGTTTITSTVTIKRGHPTTVTETSTYTKPGHGTTVTSTYTQPGHGTTITSTYTKPCQGNTVTITDTATVTKPGAGTTVTSTKTVIEGGGETSTVSQCTATVRIKLLQSSPDPETRCCHR